MLVGQFYKFLQRLERILKFLSEPGMFLVLPRLPELVDALKNPRGGLADTSASDPATSAPGPSSDED